MKIVKIELESFINMLESIYEQGVDYIDIEGEPSQPGESDVVKITILADYLALEEEEDISYNEEDMNNLI